MATIRCPSCGDDVVPFPLEREESATQYVCPSCRTKLTIDVVDEYVRLEEEEAAG